MQDPKPRVLCTQDLSSAPEALATLQEAVDLDYRASSRATLLEAIGECDAYWGDICVKVDKEVLDRAKNLKVVCVAATGTDHIDKEELARRGIRLLCIAKDYGLLDTFTATAECAWMLLQTCHRHFRDATAGALQGNWKREDFCGDQLSGRTLGVLGVGRLGKMTVEFGKAFRMRVLGCDHLPFEIEGVEPVDFDTLLREADDISIHIHMLPENYHLFNEEVFGKMKDGAVVVNTSRGDLIDEDALLRALESGKLAAFGSDVLHNEWRDDMRESPVVQYAQTHANVVITPHIGGCTHKSMVDARNFTARKLVQYLQTGEELTMP